MTTIEQRKQNSRRCRSKNSHSRFKVRITIYDYGPTPFGEPSKSRLEKLSSYQKVLTTYRYDYDEFSFVRCKVKERIVILVIGFESNLINRSSCQLLEKWDPDCVLTPITAKIK